MKNLTTVKMVLALMVMVIFGGGAFAQVANSGEPVYIDTGNPVLDAATYGAAKTTWYQSRQGQIDPTRNYGTPWGAPENKLTWTQDQPAAVRTASPPVVIDPTTPTLARPANNLPWGSGDKSAWISSHQAEYNAMNQTGTPVSREGREEILNQTNK